MKVTLNSLRMLAWLLSRLRHACSGGAPPSKSNCSESKFPTPDASQHQTTQQTTGKRETKRIRERASADVGAKSGAGSPAAARSGRHTPPPATSSSGSGTCGRSPSRPLASKCYLPLLTPQHPGRGHCRSPTDAILPAPRSADRGCAAPPVFHRPIQKIRGPDALLMRIPRGDRDPRRHPSSSARVPADRFGRRPRDRLVASAAVAGATRRRAGWIGPNPTG